MSDEARAASIALHGLAFLFAVGICAASWAALTLVEASQRRPRLRRSMWIGLPILLALYVAAVIRARPEPGGSATAAAAVIMAFPAAMGAVACLVMMGLEDAAIAIIRRQERKKERGGAGP